MAKRSREPVEILTEGFETLSVVQAWRQTDAGGASPTRVELLRRKKKSLIYRLVGAGVGGGDVIAKGCVRDTALVERNVYADVLPQLPVSQLRYYGFSPGSADEFSWLFLEEAGGVEFDPSDAEHRVLAAEWLATLHVAAEAARLPVILPDRGPGHYRTHMDEARRVIEQSHDNPLLDGDARKTLDGILDLFEVAESRWGDIEALCDQVPQTLVHGDFAERNVHVIGRGDGAILVAFDWEVAGWGLPVVDLAHADLRTYWASVRSTWELLDYQALCQLVQIGRLLRGGFAATNWSVPSLRTQWPVKAIDNLRVYDQRMRLAMRAIGWAA